ncbi:MAG: PIN domain-containing protein [Deltaproteobacteria bacterium]|nr:PIN domain-containing protein [Deltaproteobacteria bacterium]
MKLFLDTSSLLSVFDRSDEHHSECSDFWKDLFQERTYEPVISDYILDELITRIRYDISHATALQVLNSVTRLVGRGRITFVWVNQTYFDQARRIFERYNDQEFSFTDCTSFAICQDAGIQEAFAHDSDFRTFGLNVIPAQNGS